MKIWIKRTAMVAIAALTASAWASSAAAAEKTSPDVLCLGVYLFMAGSADPATKNAGLMGALYYAGRVQGANPDKDALDMVVAALSQPGSDATFQAAAPRCAQEMTALGKHWTERGKALQDAAQAGQSGG